MIFKHSLAVIFLYLFISNGAAQHAGSDLYPFLELPTSARIGALGGNQVGLADGDLNTWVNNPASLASATKGQVLLNYTSVLPTINMGFVGYARDIKDYGKFAIAINNIGYGTMDGYNEHEQSLGEFNASDFAILLGYSRQLSPRFALGTTVKPIFSSFESYRSSAIAMDFGATYKSLDSLFTLGLAIKNIGGQITSYDATRESFRPDVQIGFSQKLAHAPFRFLVTLHNLTQWDLEYTPDNSQNGSVYDTDEEVDISFGSNLLRHTIVGVEFVPSKTFFVNFGYNHQLRQTLKLESKPSTAGYSWGFGLNLKYFRFSYASARYHLAGTTNHFSFTTNFASLGL